MRLAGSSSLVILSSCASFSSIDSGVAHSTSAEAAGTTSVSSAAQRLEIGAVAFFRNRIANAVCTGSL